MIQKIKNIFRGKQNLQKEIILQNKELEWAHIYHDSIRGKKWLEELPLNIGRWAGNYSFFYVLNRVLNDYKPKSILEFGLGESSKFVMSFIDNTLFETKHIIIEQNEKWKDAFKLNNKVSNNTLIKVCPLEKIEVKGYKTNSYKNLDSEIQEKFDLYIVDGPFGSERFSRYDIVKLAENFKLNDEFIILLDDFNRLGEQDTAKELLQILKEKNIKIYTETYIGIKTVLVIVTEKYRYASSL
ncbi:hypothetical protein [Flavobacterium hungaricum]|uniref:Class I SAM-dependent methyltransferase n=1 Tax=Flavobacterium hungaricum TaxID=2082725 RepID=A0ABR9TSZ8_9FLAO|nr:hypothetical protein [Flavobacterium hungaricum]MBE8727777.1 hypothetical protein [Flavobacterium hungaricum]